MYIYEIGKTRLCQTTKYTIFYFLHVMFIEAFEA